MSYLLEGLVKDIIFVANPRTGSSAIADAILAAGGEKLEEDHHALPEREYDFANTLVAFTVRNHYDVIMSYHRQRARGMTLDHFIEMITTEEHPRFPHAGLYAHGLDHVNFIIRYESMEADLTNLLSLAGVEYFELPPQPESSIKSNDLTIQQVNKIRSVWGEEIDFMGYGDA